MVINNLCAIQSQKYMKINEKKKKESVEKLSSGYKINKAADDAAGLAISEDMRKQVRGLNRASINSQDGISAMQIADGAMAEVHDMLGRGLELCIEAANGTHSTSDRQSLQEEVDQIKTEIDAIAERTYYSELQVLKGKANEEEMEPLIRKGLAYKGGLPNWVGIGGNVRDVGYMTQEYHFTDGNTQMVSYAAASLDFSSYDGTLAKRNELYGNGFHFTCCTCTNHYSVRFTQGTGSSMEMSSNHFIYNVGIDGTKNGSDLVKRIVDATEQGNPQNHFTNLEAAPAQSDRLWLYDKRDYVHASGDRGLFGEGVAAMGVTGIDMPSSSGGKSIVLQAGSETGEFVPIKLPYLSSIKLGVAEVNVLTEEGAGYGIDLFKNASAYVSAERSRCGAYQNRMEHNILNVENTAENVTASESRIRDTNMVKEEMDFSKTSILAQASQAILAQANQNYRGVINLLTF